MGDFFPTLVELFSLLGQEVARRSWRSANLRSEIYDLQSVICDIIVIGLSFIFNDLPIGINNE